MTLFLAAWIIVAPGIQAEPNLAVGEAAFLRCRQTADSISCEPVRLQAMKAEAEDRFKLLFADLAAGRIRSQATLNTYLTKYKLKQVN